MFSNHKDFIVFSFVYAFVCSIDVLLCVYMSFCMGLCLGIGLWFESYVLESLRILLMTTPKKYPTMGLLMAHPMSPPIVITMWQQSYNLGAYIRIDICQYIHMLSTIDMQSFLLMHILMIPHMDDTN